MDLNQTLTLRYQDVERVRKNYGRTGFAGQRIHPRKSLITGLIIRRGVVDSGDCGSRV